MQSPVLLPVPAVRPPVRWLCVWARAAAWFLGVFTLLNLAGEWRTAGFDANLWWIDLRPLPEWLARGLLAAGAVTLLAFGFRPAAGPARRRWTRGVTLALLLAALANAAVFFQLLLAGKILSGLPVPFSLLVAAGLALVWREAGRATPAAPGTNSRLRVTAACAVLLAGFPVAQLFCFGQTDYRRRAEAIVVFGARAYAVGRPSDALADRVRTGVELYRQGFAPRLIFSGGPGDGAVHETEAMRRMAVRLGARAEDIVLDAAGWNTQATARNTTALCARAGLGRVLAVSHFYHLPRVKLAFRREGLDVFTVPARESYLLRQTPYNMAREIAALWVYYLRPWLA